MVHSFDGRPGCGILCQCFPERVADIGPNVHVTEQRVALLNVGGTTKPRLILGSFQGKVERNEKDKTIR